MNHHAWPYSPFSLSRMSKFEGEKSVVILGMPEERKNCII
jgi:hypothetical protein